MRLREQLIAEIEEFLSKNFPLEYFPGSLSFDSKKEMEEVLKNLKNGRITDSDLIFFAIGKSGGCRLNNGCGGA